MTQISTGHIIGCIDPRIGGPAHAENRLCMHLVKHGVNTSIFSFHYPYDDRAILWSTLNVHHLPYSPFSVALAGWNPSAFRELCVAVKSQKIQIIHNQGLWIFPNRYARLAAQKLNLPLITSVRGMLEPWTIKQKTFKKKIAWQLYEKENLESVKVFHATSEQEADSIRRAGFKQPVAVIPNGVDVQPDGDSASVENFKEFQNERVLLFLSRIDPKKGLERLLTIWRKLESQYPKWRLVIAGSGDSLYRKHLQTQHAAIPRVSWIDFIEGARKRDLWKQAKLFILPSFSENFGNVVGEALAHGIPVITTTGMPWEEINQLNCGWQAENDMQAIEKVLHLALAKSPEHLQQMGLNGKQWVRDHYDWSKTAKKMTDTYKWMLNMGVKPDCVRLHK